MRPIERIASVRARLLGWLLPPLLIVAALGATLDYILAARIVRSGFDDALGQLASALAARIAPDATGRLRLRLSGDDAALLSVEGGDTRHFLAIGSDGSYIAGDARLPVRSASNDPALVLRDVQHGAIRVREAVHRVRIHDRDVIVAIAATTQARDATLRHLWVVTLGGSLTQLALVLAIVWTGVRIGLGALLRLRDAIAAHGPADLMEIPESAAPAEARPLLRAMNQAIVRAREASEARQQFVADAAHQLRRPLTSVQAGLELLAGELRDSPQRQRARDLLIDSRRLAHTTHQLLALAQADAVAARGDAPTSIRLDRLVADAAERALDRALARGIDLGVDTRPATIEGVPWLLNEALSNLIDNALLYCPCGARVTVRCDHSDGGAFLEVEDDGPGIAPDLRQRVRERFYRGRHHGVDGSGLGLAIVAQVARVHAADFTIEEGAAGRGTRCRLDFHRDGFFGR
ncbi:MAG: sensor histidine kinase [Rhodanobacteraceae bacterium]|jgi:two-component system sensor histidine kinase TctE|nr:sensor histidine kinase [Rhodanobacteraceae bacterium]